MTDPIQVLTEVVDRYAYDTSRRPLLSESRAALTQVENLVRAAQAADRIYEGLRTDENDGTFSLWSEDQLVAALHALRPALAPFKDTP